MSYLRLSTKQDRTEARDYQFNKLIESGYNKEEYKTLIIFTSDKDLTLKSFWGTSAKHSDFIKFRTIERMQEKATELKQSADRREIYKEEQKEKNKGHKSSHAATAAAIKEELKKAFPNTKFSVKSSSFAGGNDVCVNWDNGQTVKQVEEITRKYQYGSFNGMEDIYEYTNNREDIPQAKYVSENRHISEELTKEVENELMKVCKFSPEQIADYRDNPNQLARRIIYNTEIPASYKSLSITTNKDGFVRWEEHFNLIFEVEQIEKKEPTAEQTEVKTESTETKGKVQIVDYSEKSFAVIGEFSEHYDHLTKVLGGGYNSRLSCGKGIIFSKKKLEAVKQYLTECKQKSTKEPQQEPKITEAEEVAPMQEPMTETTLKDEIKKTVDFLAEPDIKLYGHITESTKEAAKVQDVEIMETEETTFQYYDNLQDIREAAKGGKIISLCNLAALQKTK